MPHLLKCEQRGIRVDLSALERDVKSYTEGVNNIDHWLKKRLKVKGDFNVDSDSELSLAIQNAGAADLTKWEKTETGQYSTSKEALALALTDKPLQAALAYRAPVATCLRTFIEPWHA